MVRDRGDLSRLGAFIRQRRRELGLTQTELGRRMGYYQERISALECGNYGMPSLPALREIASGLGCELSELLFAAGYLDASALGAARPATGLASNRGIQSQAAQLQSAMEALHRRLVATEAIASQMVQLQHQMRASRLSIDQQIRTCLEVAAGASAP